MRQVNENAENAATCMSKFTSSADNPFQTLFFKNNNARLLTLEFGQVFHFSPLCNLTRQSRAGYADMDTKKGPPP